MNQAQKKTLLTGCGIGCAVVIVLAIVIAGVGFGLTVRLMHSSAPKLARMVADDYAEFKATNRVPAEHAAIYDELAKYANQPQATFQLLLVVKAVLDLQLDDGKVSDAELAEATAVRDYFKANPDASYFAVNHFVHKYPDLEQEVVKVGVALTTTPTP